MTRYDLNWIRVSAIAPKVSISDPDANVEHIIETIESIDSAPDIIVLPELCITGYTCADLFMQTNLLDQTLRAIDKLAMYSAQANALLVFGAPLRHNNRLYNCAIFASGGAVVGVTPKQFIPNYNEFYEARWFTSGREIFNDKIDAGFGDAPFSTNMIVEYKGVKVAAEICEDMWVPEAPSASLARLGADVIVNLSATDEVLGKHRYLVDLIRMQSARCRAAYVYASAGRGESSTDLLFAGNAIIAEDGAILSQSERFATDSAYAVADIDIEKLRNDRLKFNTFGDGPLPEGMYVNSHASYIPTEYLNLKEMGQIEAIRKVDSHPFVPASKEHKDVNCSEIISIQCGALRQRLSAIHCEKVVVGISGGLDSTLALLVAVRTFDLMGLDRKGIVGITMPGLATTEHTRGNAHKLMEELGVSIIEIPIGKAVAQHFSDIGQDPEKYDATYENSQARERTQILMDYANKCGGIVLGTGDLSELALGWATYNGDQMSMYGINASIPKTLVKHLVGWFADRTNNPIERATLLSIIDTPISPELVPSKTGEDIAQKTEDLVGPYELHDFFIYYMLRHGFSPRKIYEMAKMAFAGMYDDTTILKWLKTFYRRFFQQQFKRSCMPDGPKVGSVCLSPRGDWRMPSDATASLWLSSLERI